MESLWKGLEKRPNDPVLFARLRETLEQRNDFKNLTSLYIKRADAVGGEEAVFLLFAVAEVWSVKLNDPEVSSDAFRHLLKVSADFDDESRQQIHNTVETLCRDRRDWTNLHILYREILNRLEPGEKRALILLKLGDLYQKHLSQVTQAADAFRQAFEEPDSPQDRVKQALQALWQEHPTATDTFRVFGDILRESINKNLGVNQANAQTNARELLKILQRRLEHVGAQGTKNGQAALLLEMGQLNAIILKDAEKSASLLDAAYHAGADTVDVVNALKELISATGDRLSTLTLMRDLLTELNAWGDLVKFGLREVTLIASPHDKAAVLMTLANIQQFHCDDLDSACDLYIKAYDSDPSLNHTIIDQLLAIGTDSKVASRGLKHIYRSQEQYDDLLELLTHEAEHEQQPAACAALHIELAQICAEHMARPDSALEHFANAITHTEDNIEPITNGLLELYRQGYYLTEVKELLHASCRKAGSWSALTDLYTLSLDGSASDEEQAAIHFEFGQVLEHEISELKLAMEHYQNAFQCDPRVPEYIEAGRTLYRKMGELKMVANLYDAQLQTVQHPGEAAAIFLEKSKVLADELEDIPRALEALCLACSLDSELLEAKTRLISMVQTPAGEAALGTLEDAYRKINNQGEAALLFMTLGELFRVELSQNATDDRYESLLTHANAFDLRAVALDPVPETIDNLAERLEAGLAAQKRWPELLDLLTLEAEHAITAEARIDLLSRQAQLASLYLPRRAAPSLQAILDIDPERQEIFTKLLETFQTAPVDLEALTRSYQWALDNALWLDHRKHTDARAELILEFAQLQRQRGADAHLRELMFQLSELFPNHEAVLDHFQQQVHDEESGLELFRILEFGLSHLTDPDRRAERRIQLAEVALNNLNDKLLAIDQHLAILHLPGASPQRRLNARETLYKLYREMGQLDLIAELLTDEIGEPDSSHERQLECLNTLADLYQFELKDLNSALLALAQTIDRSPDALAVHIRRADLFHQLNATGGEISALRQFISTFDRLNVVEVDGDTPSLETILKRLAAILVNLERNDEAAEVFTRLLNFERSRDDALNSLQQALLSINNQQQLMDALEQQTVNSNTAELKVLFLSRKALLAEQVLQNPSLAISTWERVLKEDPSQSIALQALEALHEQLQQWPKVIRTCQARIALADQTGERVRLLRKVARLHLQFDQPDSAKTALKDILRELPEDLLAYRTLYDIFLMEEDWTELISINDAFLSFEDNPKQRLEILNRQVELCDRHFSIAQTISALERLIHEFPDDADSLALFTTRCVEDSRWARAAQLIEHRVSIEVDTEKSTALLFQLAEIQRDHLASIEAAAETLQRLLKIQEGHRVALTSLESLYSELEDHSALAETQAILVELGDEPELHCRRLLSLSQHLEHNLGRTVEAFEYLVRVHNFDPHEPTHDASMIRLAGEHQLWVMLLDVINVDISNTSALETKIALLHRKARITEEELNDPMGAFDLFNNIFQLRAVQGDALQHMERLARLHNKRWPDVLSAYQRLTEDTEDIEEMIQIFWIMVEHQDLEMSQPAGAFSSLSLALDMGIEEEDTLKKIHTLAEKYTLWKELVDLYDQRWQSLEAFPDEQVPILVDTAELIIKHLDDPRLALDRFVMAFQHDPWNDDIRERLHELAVQQKSWTRLFKLYEDVVQSCHQRNHTAGQLVFLNLIASTHDTDRGDPSAALDTYSRIFQLSPEEPEIGSRLEDTGLRSDRLREVVSLYVQAARTRPQNAISFFMAAVFILLDPLDDLTQSISLLREALEPEPDNKDVLELLETLLQRQGEIEPLINFYIDRTERTLGRQQRLVAYLKVAELMSESAEPERAIEYFRRALRLEPKNLAIFDALILLHERLEQHDHTARTLEQIVEVAREDDIERVISCFQRLAKLYEENERHTRATDTLIKLLAIRPGFVGSFDQLVAILRKTGRLEALFQHLEDRLNTLQSLDPSSEDHRDEDGEPLSPQQVSSRQRLHLRAMISLATEVLGTPRLAVEPFKQLIALETQPGEPLSQLAGLFATLERWQEQIDTLRQLLLVTEDLSSRAALFKEIAGIQENKLHQPAKATGTLSRLIEESPQDGLAIADLARLHAHQEQWAPAVKRYLQACELEPDHALSSTHRAALLCAASSIFEHHTHEITRAIDTYQLALDTSPRCHDARRALIRLLVDPEHWERLATLLDTERQHLDDPQDRSEIAWQLGTLFAQNGKSEDAIRSLQDTLADSPQHLKALRDLGNIAFHLQRWDLVQHCNALLLTDHFSRMSLETHKLSKTNLTPYENPDSPAYVLYNTRLGQALAALGRVEEAFECFLQTLRVRSNNLISLLSLGFIHFANEAFDEASRHLSKLLHTHKERLTTADLAQAQHHLASIYHRRGQLKLAKRELATALQDNPLSPPLWRLELAVSLQLEVFDDANVALKHLIPVVEQSEQLTLLVRQGDLLNDHLNDPEGAVAAFQDAISIDPENIYVLKALIALQTRRADWKAASLTAGQLLSQFERLAQLQPEKSHDPQWISQMTEALLIQGDIAHKGFDDTEAAVSSYRRALSISPDNLEPLMKVGFMLGHNGHFDALFDLFNEQIMRLDRDNPSRTTPLLLQFAQLLLEQLNAPDHALNVFLQANTRLPEDTSTHEAILDITLRPEHFNAELASRSLQSLLRSSPLTQERLRQMLSLHDLLGDADGVRRTMKFINLCRGLSRDEQQHLRTLQDPLSNLKPGALAGKAYGQQVRLPQSFGPFADLMTFASSSLTGAVYQSVSTFGVAAGDLINNVRGLNVANTFRLTQNILGISDIELYLKKGGFKGVQIVMARPPAVIIGEDISRGLFNKEQQFILGRALELTRPEFILSAALSPFEFATLLEALLIYGGHDHARQQTAQRDNATTVMIRDWLERLQDVCAPDKHEQLCALVSNIDPTADPFALAEQWAQIAGLNALQTGITVAGDSATILKRLIRDDAELNIPTVRNIDDINQAISSSPTLRHVVLYILGEPLSATRAMLLSGEAFEPFAHPNATPAHPDIENLSTSGLGDELNTLDEDPLDDSLDEVTSNDLRGFELLPDTNSPAQRDTQPEAQDTTAPDDHAQTAEPMDLTRSPVNTDLMTATGADLSSLAPTLEKTPHSDSGTFAQEALSPPVEPAAAAFDSITQSTAPQDEPVELPTPNKQLPLSETPTMSPSTLNTDKSLNEAIEHDTTLARSPHEVLTSATRHHAENLELIDQLFDSSEQGATDPNTFATAPEAPLPKNADAEIFVFDDDDSLDTHDPSAIDDAILLDDDAILLDDDDAILLDDDDAILFDDP